MPSDWSDPDRAERELARREGREPSGGDAAADQQGFAEAVLTMRRLLERIEAETASQTEDIAGLRDMLAADRPSLPTPRENAPGTEIAEAEGRLTAHVDRLGDSIEHTVRTWPAVREMAMTASAVPAELGKLRETVNKLDERPGQADRCNLGSHPPPYKDGRSGELESGSDEDRDGRALRERGAERPERSAADSRHGSRTPPPLEAGLVVHRGRHPARGPRLPRRRHMAPMGTRTDASAGYGRRFLDVARGRYGHACVEAIRTASGLRTR